MPASAILNHFGSPLIILLLNELSTTTPPKKREPPLCRICNNDIQESQGVCQIVVIHGENEPTCEVQIHRPPPTRTLSQPGYGVAHAGILSQ